MRLSKVKLDRGGYDRRGRYYGVGRPLYRAEAEVCGKDREVYVRAGSRSAAKRGADELRKYAKWPHCGGGYGRVSGRRKKRRSRRR